MELPELRAFLAVAEQLNFSAAARSLGCSQQALSDRVRRLEDGLGMTLFDRDTRHVSLTAQGRELVPAARDLVRAAEAFRGEAARIAAGRSGRVRIGFARSALAEIAPRVIGRVREAQPAIELLTEEMATPDLPEAVRSGRVDIALVRWADDLPGLFSEVLRRQRTGVVVRADDPLAAEGELALVELADHVLLLHDRAALPARFDAVLAACEAAGFAPRVASRRLPYDPTFSEVAEGHGVSLAAEAVTATLPAGLRWVPLAGGVLQEPTRVLWHPGRADRARDAVLAGVRQVAREENWVGG